MTYAFRPMVTVDLPLVNAWLATPDVARWWEGAIDRDDLADPASRQWIVSHAGVAFAYLQDYDPHAEVGHPFEGLPPGSLGIDQFIGVPEMLGQGHGSAFIRAHIEALFERGAPAVGTDPHPDNARAIRAYEKAGFSPGPLCNADWGPCLLMTRFRL